jgi:hypothetical protein
MQLVWAGRIALVLLVAGSASTFAQGTGFFAEDVEWKEQETQLPPFPQLENLVRVQVSGPTRLEFFVDVSSVSVGSDGVVRYSLVARSPSGGENISFEGIRCRTMERRLYAIGRSADNSWSPQRTSDWVDFRRAKANSYHETLASQYFCQDRTTVPDSSRVIYLLKRG